MDTQNPQPTQEAVDKVVGGIQKDFKIVGSHRVHAWYAWAIVGIVFGMALGIVYVANRSVQVQESDAAALRKPVVVAQKKYEKLPAKLVALITKHEQLYGPITRVGLQTVSLSGEGGDPTLVLSEKDILQAKTGADWVMITDKIAEGLSGSAPLEVTFGPDQLVSKKARPYLLIGPNAQSFIGIINAMPAAGLASVATTEPKKQCKCEKIASAEFSMIGPNGDKLYIIQVNKDEDAVEPFEFDTSLESFTRKKFTEKKVTCTADTECATACKPFVPTLTYDDLITALKSATAKAKAKELKPNITTMSASSVKDGEDNGKCQEAVVM